VIEESRRNRAGSVWVTGSRTISMSPGRRWPEVTRSGLRWSRNRGATGRAPSG